MKKKLQFIKKVFGDYSLDGRRENVAVKCPACQHHKKKLSICLANNLFHCWVCEYKGKNLGVLLRKYYPRYLREHNSLFPSSQSTNAQPKEEEIVEIPKGFCLLGAKLKSRDPDIRAVINYLRKVRKLSVRDLWYYKLGTCVSGKYRRKVIFPSFDVDGTLNFYVSRVIDEGITFKYENSKVSKVDVIFNEINIDWSKELTLVEGPFDLVKCDDNSTCLLGSSLEHSFKLFQKIVQEKTPIVLALDRDVEKKTYDIANLLNKYGIPVRVLETQHFDDVGAMEKGDFIRLKDEAQPWNKEKKLLCKIRQLKRK